MTIRFSDIQASPYYPDIGFYCYLDSAQGFGMRTLEQITAKLNDLPAGVTQETIRLRLGIPQSAVSNLAAGTRKLKYHEALTLMNMLWPDDPYGEGEAEVDARVSAELMTAIEALLLAQGMHPDDLALARELLPSIRAEMKSAASVGDDPISAARAVARLLWKPNARTGRVA